MCRLLGWVAREPESVATALGDAELAGFTALARQHCDGWGMARWSEATSSASIPSSLATDGSDGRMASVATAAPPRATLAVDRSTTRADLDPTYAALTAGAAADAGFVHLRWATPGLPVRPENTHPFVFGSLAFAHNGAIHPQDRLDEMIPPGWADRIGGTTDSERYFAALAARLEAGETVASAAAAVVRTIFATLLPTSLNATLLAPDALYVINANDPSKAPSLCSSSGGEDPSTATDITFYDLRYRVRPHTVVVASSGFAQSAEDGWRPMPNMSVLRIERGTLATTLTPLAG